MIADSKIPITVIQRTLALIRALKNEYGAQRAMDIWAGMSELIDDDNLTIAVFNIMLQGGDFGDRITILSWNGTDKIAAIKCVRQWTGLDLRDSKKLVEDARPYTGQENLYPGQSVKIARHHIMSVAGERLDIDYASIVKSFFAVGMKVQIE